MDSSEKSKRIVIIGGNACGAKAAARARRLDPKAEIIVVDKGEFISYAGCGLPFYVAGAVKNRESLLSTAWGATRDVAFFRDVKNITFRTRTICESINRTKKEVRLLNMITDDTDFVQYDKLVLATGATPIIPPILGIDLKNVFTLRHIEDAEAIIKSINETEAEKAVIIGGGRIALEIIDALTAQAVDSTIIEMQDYILSSVMDANMSELLTDHISREGVAVHTGERVIKLEAGSDKFVKKVLTDKREIKTDIVIVAVGVRPNSELAKEAGLEIGDLGGIIVDEQMRTSDPDIYAGGDCVESSHIVSGMKIYAPSGATANKHGRVIGTNITGGKNTFPGSVGTCVLKTMGINVASTGLTKNEAEKQGRRVVTALVPGMDKSHFYPGGKPIMIKLVADAEDETLLGAQMIGAGDVIRRNDIVATAISLNASVSDLLNLDMGYAPPFSSAIDPLLHAANLLSNKLDGIAAAVSSIIVKEALSNENDDFIILDVRTPAETQKSHLKGDTTVEIPLEELRSRTYQLPKDKKIFCLCKIGARAYEASLILKGEGLEEAAFIEGGLSAFSNNDQE